VSLKTKSRFVTVVIGTSESKKWFL